MYIIYLGVQGTVGVGKEYNTILGVHSLLGVQGTVGVGIEYNIVLGTE